MDQTDTNLDLELLAALADGRLSGKERERAVKMLASSDDALEIFANTVREKPQDSATVVPISRARSWRWAKIAAPLAAAAAIAFAMLPRLLGTSGLVIPATMQLASAPRFSDAVRGDWDDHKWAVNRGVGSSGPAGVGSEVEAKLAFRLGVRTVDVVVALRVPDTALAGRLTAEITETLKSVDFAQAVAARYVDFGKRISMDPPAKSIDRATEIEKQLGDLLGSPSFTLGQWAEVADLAAQAREPQFFSSSYGMSYIKSAIPKDRLGDAAETIQRINARLAEGPDDHAFDDIHVLLQQLIQRRGS